MSEHTGAWFTDPEFLRSIGRDLIAHFFAAFAADLQAENVTLPDPKLADDLYFQEAARFLSARRFRLWLSPNHLPVLRRAPPFTLEPLRRFGPDALEADGVKGIVKITLCGFKVVCRNGHCQTHTSQADDIFAGRKGPGPHHPDIPQTGSLTWASFSWSSTVKSPLGSKTCNNRPFLTGRFFRHRNVVPNSDVVP